MLLIITLAVLGQLVAATTLERRKKELLLEQIALHDPITELPNVGYLRNSLEGLSRDAQRPDVSHMLVCARLPYRKTANIGKIAAERG